MQKPSPLATFIFCTSRWRSTHTHTHARAGAGNENNLSPAAADEHAGCQVNYVHPTGLWGTRLMLYWLFNTWTQTNLKQDACLCLRWNHRRASGTIGGQKRGQKMWAAPLPARSREASWPPEPFRVETPQAWFSCSGEEVQLVIVVRERLWTFLMCSVMLVIMTTNETGKICYVSNVNILNCEIICCLIKIWIWFFVAM